MRWRYRGAKPYTDPRRRFVAIKGDVVEFGDETPHGKWEVVTDDERTGRKRGRDLREND